MNMVSIKAMIRIVCLSTPGYEGAVSGVGGVFDVVCNCISASVVAPLSTKV